ncbi:uncharacterized protein N0V89_000015 [Didymosphaeria variabile]|uniref:Uncharacterized protein n=1 Tax=Didymosphaeria variabile TaxID=1932322 RepID=A0A9W8XUG0_9PLEO|nr:uncharacterized protein N0V89_000015 [Didymosphaeria variabile]KAJ4359461.1 hypothetical protein N0V89_000015 [Didymosphaeria variabile]
MANGNSVDRALEAVSICPRQQYRRPVKDLSYEVASHVQAYLDHQRYEQAYIFLHSLLAAGTSITTPAKPYVGLLAPAAQIALASTLIVYPHVTTRATSDDAIKGSDAALKYLRCVQNTVDRSVESLRAFRTAFTFTGSRRRGPALHSPLDSPASTRGYDIEQLNDVAANAQSLWHCAEDFWHIVGWAFNCSVKHEKRWRRWRLWLDIMLSFIEAEWDDCTNNGDPLQDTLIWQYICSQEPLAGNTRKRIFRAIHATGDPQSLKEFGQVWDKELQAPKKEDTKKHTSLVDFEKGDIGDYASEDEDVDMQDAPRSAIRGRRSRNACKESDTSLPLLEDAFIPDYDAAVQRLGGIDAVELRQRLVSLLSKVARGLPDHFTSVEGLFDTLAVQLRYFPVSVLHLLITTSRLSPADQVALNVTVLTALTAEKYINYTTVAPTQGELERLLLPHRARTQGFADNAKVSLLLEQVFMYMLEPVQLQPTEALRAAVESGIKERNSVKGMKENPNEEEVGRALLVTSSERLRGLLELLELMTGEMPVRESPRKAKTFSFGPALSRPEVPFLLDPRLQELGSHDADRGLDLPDLKEWLQETEKEGEDKVRFDWEKIDTGAVEEGWNSKIVLVSHGAISHFLTEDWEIEDPMLGTNWSNCEVREYVFSEESKLGDAHLVETEESRARRPPYAGVRWARADEWKGVKSGDKDEHVVEEVREVEEQAQ